jgi:hypothetical protein
MNIKKIFEGELVFIKKLKVPIFGDAYCVYNIYGRSIDADNSFFVEKLGQFREDQDGTFFLDISSEVIFFESDVLLQLAKKLEELNEKHTDKI